MSRKTAESYAASVARLKTLVDRLESAEVDVDELESVVKESVELVNLCRSRLRATQSSVDSLLAGLQDSGPTAPPLPAEPAEPPVAGAGTERRKRPTAGPKLSITNFDEVEEDPFADD